MAHVPDYASLVYEMHGSLDNPDALQEIVPALGWKDADGKKLQEQLGKLAQTVNGGERGILEGGLHYAVIKVSDDGSFAKFGFTEATSLVFIVAREAWVPSDFYRDVDQGPESWLKYTFLRGVLRGQPTLVPFSCKVNWNGRRIALAAFGHLQLETPHGEAVMRVAEALQLKLPAERPPDSELQTVNGLPTYMVGVGYFRAYFRDDVVVRFELPDPCNN